MSKYATTMQIIRSVRQQTDIAVLYYSAGGKDGIALLDMLAGEFPKVVCYYMYLLPNLEHVQPYIRWAQRHYSNVEVRQIEHYQKDIIDKCCFFKNPDPAYQMKKGEPGAKRVRKIGDIEQAVRDETGVRWAFSGMKGVDGYMKRMRLKTFKKRNGTYITDKGMVYPLAEWTNAEVLHYISTKNLITPFVYDNERVSQGFNITLNTLLLMRGRYPNDYRRILEAFPYSEKLIFDYEQDKATREQGSQAQ